MWRHLAKMKVYLCVSVFLYATVSCSIAPFIQPCHSWDSACLKNSAQRTVPVVAAGIPSLDMRPLDPMYVDSVVASQAGLNMNLRNTVVKGLRQCTVVDLRRLPTQTFLDLKCSVVLRGDYSLSGNLLILPIEGQGKYKIKIRDILVKVVLDIGERASGGERYWTVNNWRHTAEVLGEAQYLFQNLFNGNKELADRVQSFANANWREIFDEVAPPMINVVVGQVVQETTKLFNRVPIRELALD